jgi:peptide deformylase
MPWIVMVLPIVLYGDPVLRTKGKLVTEVTPEVRRLAADMLETMYDARGVGLAAQQIGVALQLAVVDVSHDPQCITYLRVNGVDTPMQTIMPLVFLNPKLEFGKAKATSEEGCLSFPDVRENIRRSSDLKATLTLLDGSTIVLETDGLLSRAIQHETDHLNGILFIDRVSAAAKIGMKRRLREAIEDWQEQISKGISPTKPKPRKKGEVDDDDDDED